MSRKAKIILWVWSVVIICVVIIATQSIMKNQRIYTGKKIAFHASSGYYLDIASKGTSKIKAASQEGYFRILQDETNLFGIPFKTPLNYDSDYFFLEGEITSGRWQILDGSSISFEIENEENETLNVVLTPTRSTIVSSIVYSILISFGIWFLGLLILALIFDF